MTDMTHLRRFAEFCAAELATGGPDPQLATMTELSRGKPLRDRIWLAGCYCSHHCVSSAYAVWRNWPLSQVLDQGPELHIWLDENWSYLPVRPEMKSHRMVEKRARCLLDFARLAFNFERVRWSELPFGEMLQYDSLWNWSIDNVKFFGRYMAIKFLEQLRQIGVQNTELKDLRGKNAWSPRRALAMIWPDEPGLTDEHDKSLEAVTLVEDYADRTRKELAEEFGVECSFFQLQVMLCEYREACVGGYYPGASLDEELDYMRLTAEKFDLGEVYEVRSRLFSWKYLGERNNWRGTRREQFANWRYP